jgi:hypothetical protein
LKLRPVPDGIYFPSPVGECMEDFSKREMATIAVGILIIVALTVWATFAVMPYLFPTNLSDPLTKAGGLKIEPQLQVK